MSSSAGKQIQEFLINLLVQMDEDALNAEQLMKEYAVGLLDYLVENPGWHYGWTLHDRVVSAQVDWGKWERVVQALKRVGLVEVKQEGYGIAIRITTASWLHEVQRRAAARSGDVVSV